MIKIVKSRQNELRHEIVVISSLFFNSSNPSSEPELYLDLLEQLIKLFFTISKERKAKLVVNTCGWVEGLGAYLLVELAKMIFICTASQFIQLESENKPCEVDLNKLGCWQTKIKGDVRHPSFAN